jgi:DNA polymerase delta subunit 4
MPRGRPATSARKTSAGRQNTLSFAGKPTKVTKPGQQTTTLGKNAEAKAQKLLSEQPTQVSIATPSVSGDETISIDTKSAETKAQDAKIENELTTAELAFRDQTQAEHVERTPEEEQASKISDTQIKKYWKAKEDARIYPRVHQEGMSLHEKVLREFDLSSHFGVSISLLLRSMCTYADGRIKAMYRRCANKEMEASAQAWLEPAHRGSSCAAQRRR